MKAVINVRRVLAGSVDWQVASSLSPSPISAKHNSRLQDGRHALITANINKPISSCSH